MPDITFQPLTPDRWPDLVRLFGPTGACGGCWCMTWRLPRADFERSKGEGNKRRLAALVRKGRPPGVLAYDGATPVAWCAIAPRSDYPALERSRVMASVDAQPVWSVSCFFILREYRHQGLTVGLLNAAADYARDQGATIVEGYPYDVRKHSSDVFVWTGVAASFVRAGFAEVARRSPTRPIMRKVVKR
jgi:GNAT superfamily N-acetyltransferase